MRLPRYARGLTLVRFGMFAMLLNFAITAFIVTKMIGMKGLEDVQDLMTWTRYGMWANLGAFALMLIGVLVALPDFLASKMPAGRLVISAIGFVVCTAAMAWSSYVLGSLIDVLNDPDASMLELSRAVERIDNNHIAIIIRDLAYPVGVVGVLRSIRQTAVANEHYALRDASSQMSSLMVGLAILDILYQLMASAGVLSFSFMIAIVIGIVGGLALIGFWIYMHLRLAKFLKAAAILVHEPHNLPVATLVIRDKPSSSAAVTDDDAPPVIRQSGPLARPRRPSAPPIRPTTAPTFSPAAPAASTFTPPPPAAPSSEPSQPIIVVPAELRPVAAPRAETAPGAPTDEPKLLR